MSDAPQGPDWWQASDDKWYPPPRPQMPGEADAGVATTTPMPGMPPPGGAPTGFPTGPPTGPPGGGFPPTGPPSGGFPPGAPPSPYGGMPPVGQPPGNQNRTPLYIAIGAVVAAALVGLIVVLSGGDEDDEPTATTEQQAPTTEEQAPTTEDGSTPTTGDTGGSGSTAVDGLVLADSGFSTFPGYDGTAGSYGILINNSSDEARVNFTVDVAIYDQNDTVIGTGSHTVARLNAGETLGIGYDITDDVTNGIGRLDVTFEEGYGSSAPEGAFAVSEVATTTDDYSTETTFTVESSFQVDADSPYAYAIYRDAAGTIIGGTYGFVDLVPAGGRAQGSISSYEPVPNVATTEVYVDQGYF